MADEHFSTFSKQAKETPKYKAFEPVPCNLDFLVQYFKYNELSKSVSLLNKWLPKNPYKNDFDAFVDEFFVTHSHLPESETLRQLHVVLEEKQLQALSSLRKVVRSEDVPSADAVVSDMQQRVPGIGAGLPARSSAVLL